MTSLILLLALPVRAEFSATVNVQGNAPLATMSPYGLGVHTSPYYNSMGEASLDERLEESGVTTLRYGGGGYADVLHWSIAQPQWVNGITGGGLSPWWGEPDNFGYVGPGSDFGNFIRLLDRTDNSQAVVTVNYGSALKLVGGQSVVPDFGGQPQEAAAQVAYANSDPAIYGTTEDITIGVDEQGNDWKSAGYWARLRASSAQEYQSWATADGVYEPLNSFLAINRDAPVGIEYWEIGNETFGTGFYDYNTNGYSVNYDVPYPYSQNARRGNADLSPAHYGQEVVQYSDLMKAIDPSIKIGAVLTTPPDDHNWDYWPRSGGPNNPSNKHWNAEVLSQPGVSDSVDFVMVHWYPYIGEEFTDQNGNNQHNSGEPVNNGSSLLAFPRQKIKTMIEGATSGIDSGANAGVEDWLSIYGLNDAEIMVTEFGYFGEVWDGGTFERNDYRTAAQALFVADAYASWLELGVTSVQYLELLTKQFLDDNNNLGRGPAFYGVSMVDKLAKPGDTFLGSSSSEENVRVHASLQASGNLAVMLLNLSVSESASVTVNIADLLLAGSGNKYSLLGGTSLTESEMQNLENSFVLEIAPRSMNTIVINLLQLLPGDFDTNGMVDGIDFLEWQRQGLGTFELESWQVNYGLNPQLLDSRTVPETPTILLGLWAYVLSCANLRRSR